MARESVRFKGENATSMWHGMEKYYGDPKRVRSWKRWIQPRRYLELPKVTLPFLDPTLIDWQLAPKRLYVRMIYK